MRIPTSLRGLTPRFSGRAEAKPKHGPLQPLVRRQTLTDAKIRTKQQRLLRCQEGA